MANDKGAKPDKLMRNALLLELHREETLSDGEKIKRLRKVANALISKAIDGDVGAIREINDRIDGKVPQGTVLAGDPENPIITATMSEIELARRIVFALELGARSIEDS